MVNHKTVGVHCRAIITQPGSFWMVLGVTDHIEMIFLSMECVLLIKIHKNMSKLVIPL